MITHDERATFAHVAELSNSKHIFISPRDLPPLPAGGRAEMPCEGPTPTNSGSVRREEGPEPGERRARRSPPGGKPRRGSGCRRAG